MKEKFSQVLLTFSFFLLLILGTFTFTTLNQHFYEKEFTKYSIYDKFEDPNEVNREFSKVLHYLKGRSPTLESDFFNEKEKTHLQDVKTIYTTFFFLIIASSITFFILVLINRKNKKLLIRSLQYGSLISLIFLALLILGLLISFEQMFILIHKIFFTNDLWMLDPATDNLIKLLPLQIFYDLGKRFLLYSMTFSIFIFILTKLLKKKLL